MAERRAAGFNIPLNFYDGPEVESIPKRIRAAAIGVWALAGDYSATQLTDGYVGPGILKMIGCTDAIRAALKATINKKGELSPLWIDARDGGVQLTNWPKHQRTSVEVTNYREAEAERKRRDREAKAAAKDGKVRANFDGTNAYLTRNFAEDNANLDTNLRRTNDEDNHTGNAPTSGNAKMSGRTNDGQVTDVRTDGRDPKTETETETVSTYVEHAFLRNVGDPAAQERGQETGRSAPVDPSASRLVATLIPANIPAAVKTSLRLGASQLMVSDRLSADVVAETLRRWCAKPDAGPGLLAHIASEVVRENAQLATNGGRPPGPPNKLRSIAELAARERAAENDRNTTAREEILP